MLRVRLKAEPNVEFIGIDNADYDPRVHTKIDADPIPQPPQHLSATSDLIAVVMKA